MISLIYSTNQLSSQLILFTELEYSEIEKQNSHLLKMEQGVWSDTGIDEAERRLLPISACVWCTRELTALNTQHATWWQRWTKRTREFSTSGNNQINTAIHPPLELFVLKGVKGGTSGRTD